MQITLTLTGDATSLASVLALIAAGGNTTGNHLTGTATNIAESLPIVSAQSQPVPVVSNPVQTVIHNDDAESDDIEAAPGTLDKEGLPWDARIHSKKPTLTAKGLWRKQRGANDAFVAQVEAELRTRTAQQAQPVVQQFAQQPVPVTMPQQFAQPDNAQFVQQAQQPVVQQFVQQPQQFAQPDNAQFVQQPQPVVQNLPTDFNTFLSHVSTKMNVLVDGAPMITSEYLNQVAQRVAGVATITEIGSNPQLIAAVAQQMINENRW